MAECFFSAPGNEALQPAEAFTWTPIIWGCINSAISISLLCKSISINSKSHLEKCCVGILFLKVIRLITSCPESICWETFLSARAVAFRRGHLSLQVTDPSCHKPTTSLWGRASPYDTGWSEVVKLYSWGGCFALCPVQADLPPGCTWGCI